LAIRRAAGTVDAIECKYNPDRLDVASILAFREIYAKGRNYVVSPLVKTPYVREQHGVRISYCGFDAIAEWKVN
jgi:hypothetical protein